MKWHTLYFYAGIVVYMIGLVCDLLFGLEAFDKLATLVLYLMIVGVYYKIGDD